MEVKSVRAIIWSLKVNKVNNNRGIPKVNTSPCDRGIPKVNTSPCSSQIANQMPFSRQISPICSASTIYYGITSTVPLPRSFRTHKACANWWPMGPPPLPFSSKLLPVWLITRTDWHFTRVNDPGPPQGLYITRPTRVSGNLVSESQDNNHWHDSESDLIMVAAALVSIYTNCQRCASDVSIRPRSPQFTCTPTTCPVVCWHRGRGFL